MIQTISAVQYLGRLDGGTQPHLLAASDGEYYVTKFKNNPQHIRVLANEMLATLLGENLNLPMARMGILDVPGPLIEQTPALYIRHEHGMVRCSPGRQAASQYIRNSVSRRVIDCSPEISLQNVCNLQDFARVLVFDRWTGNTDSRQAIFSQHPGEKAMYSATFVDHSYCFDAGRWNFPDLPAHGRCCWEYVYSNVTGWESFEPTLTCVEEMDLDAIAACAGQVPAEWYEYDTNALDRLIEVLYGRRSLVRNMIRALRNSKFNPFPNWTCC